MKNEVWQRLLTGLIAGLAATGVVAVGAGIGQEDRAPRDEVLGQSFERDDDGSALDESAAREQSSGSVSVIDDLADTADPARGTFSRDQATPPAPSSSGARPTPPAASNNPAPSLSPSTTAPRPAPSGRPASGTRVVEQSDTSGQFTYRDGQVSEVSARSGGDHGLVGFVLEATAVDDHGRAAFTITNRSGAAIRFPDGGINVRISIVRPDGSVRVYEVRNASVTSLQDKGTAEGELDFPFVSDGTYKYAGEVLVEY